MTLIVGALLVSTVSGFLTVLTSRRHSALYRVLAFSCFLFLLITLFLLSGYTEESLSTFDGTYYLQRLNLYRDGVSVGDSSVRLRDVGYDVFINLFFQLFDLIYPLTSRIPYYLALTPNLLAGCLLVLSLEEYLSPYIRKNLLCSPFLCPYIIAFSVSLDREIVVALCVCLFAIYSCSKRRGAFPVLVILSFFLFFLRPSILFTLLSGHLLRSFILSIKLTSSRIALLIFTLFLLLIISSSFFFQSELIPMVSTNSSSAVDTSGLLGSVYGYSPILRTILYLISSFLTPLFDPSLLLTSPVDFILTFSAFWKLFFLYLLLQLFITRGLNSIFTDSNALFSVLSLCIGYFFYTALLFNNRHIAQLVPLAYFSTFYISKLTPIRPPSKLLVHAFLVILPVYFMASLIAS